MEAMMAGGLVRGCIAGGPGQSYELLAAAHDPVFLFEPTRRVIFVDRDGWPVEGFRGRRLTNVIRLILHTRGLVIGRAATRRYR